MEDRYIGGCAEPISYQYGDADESRNRIGLLGGTFDPVHNGHLAMAGIACAEFGLGQVIFIPLGAPPHKTGRSITAAQHRLEMIRLAIEDKPAFSVSTIEISRSGFTYTVDTLETLTRQNPRLRYSYIIGADTLFELCSWKTFSRVAALTRFICVLRPGLQHSRVFEYASALNEMYGHIIDIADRPGPDICSTEIRALAAQGMPLGRFVPPAVQRYILQNRVYQENCL